MSCAWMAHQTIRLGVSLILIDPEGDVNEYALHFKFLATNNEAEYEL